MHWAVAGDVSLADVLTALFLVSFAADRIVARDARVPGTAWVVLGFLALFLVVYLVGFFNLDTTQALAQFGKGLAKFVLHFLFLAAGAYLAAAAERFYWWALAALVGGHRRERGLRRASSSWRARGPQPRRGAPLAADGRRELDQRLRRAWRARRSTGRTRSRATRTTSASCSLVPLLVLTPIYLRLERGHRLRAPLGVLLAFLLVVELSTLSRSGLLGLAVGAFILAVPYRGYLGTRALLVPLAGVCAFVAYVVYRRLDFFETVIRSRLQTGGDLGALRRLRLRPGRPLGEPALRPRPEQLLRLLRVRHRPDELGAALVLRRAPGRDRDRRDAALRVLPRLAVRAPAQGAGARAGAGGREGTPSPPACGRSRGG